MSKKEKRTILVAAFDSKQKEKADYICTGVHDERIINHVIQTYGNERKIEYDGTFKLQGSIKPKRTKK